MTRGLTGSLLAIELGQQVDLYVNYLASPEVRFTNFERDSGPFPPIPFLWGGHTQVSGNQHDPGPGQITGQALGPGYLCHAYWDGMPGASGVSEYIQTGIPAWENTFLVYYLNADADRGHEHSSWHRVNEGTGAIEYAYPSTVTTPYTNPTGVPRPYEWRGHPIAPRYFVPGQPLPYPRPDLPDDLPSGEDKLDRRPALFSVPGPSLEITPDGDQVTKPEHVPDRPGPNVKERKGRMGKAFGVAWRSIGAVTEGMDHLSCIHRALPRKLRRKLFIKNGRKAPTQQQKIKEAYDYSDQIDLNSMARCMFKNAIEDRLYATLNKPAGKMARDQGRAIGYGAGDWDTAPEPNGKRWSPVDQLFDWSGLDKSEPMTLARWRGMSSRERHSWMEGILDGLSTP